MYFTSTPSVRRQYAYLNVEAMNNLLGTHNNPSGTLQYAPRPGYAAIYQVGHARGTVPYCRVATYAQKSRAVRRK